MAKDFHDKPYDAGTLTKLRIFELYAQEWIPVFVSKEEPPFSRVEIFDFFCGPGTDSAGLCGSPLRILTQLQKYHAAGMAGWDKVTITVHLYDEDCQKIKILEDKLREDGWVVPGVNIDCKALAFEDALNANHRVLADGRIAKLLIIDQYGVDAVTDEVFKRLVNFKTTDLIFFLSSSTLYRFREHPAIKQKIERPDDSYHVHRAAADYYLKLIPPNEEYFLGRFSIKKGSNIYGLIFGSRHPLGIHKFLEVAWKTDGIAGEANFDIERENMTPEEGILPLDVMKPTKEREFEQELATEIKAGRIQSESEAVRFAVQAGMTCRHCEPVLRDLKQRGIIDLAFKVPSIRNLNEPRPIRLTGKGKL